MGVATVERATAGSARSKVRAWIREAIRDRGDVHLPTLAGEVVEHFRGDQEFVDAYLAETLPDIVYATAQAVLGTTRVRLADELVQPERLRAATPVLRSKWGHWLEHVGDRHVRLGDMTKGLLLVAAEERERRGDTEYVIARTWRHLAGAMETDWETVNQRFSAAEIDAAYAAAKEG